MKNVRMLFVCSDRDFEERFLRYMINDCKNVHVFVMEPERYEKICRSGAEELERYDVILVDEGLYVPAIREAFSGCVILITENEKGSSGKDTEGCRHIWKYQSALKILREMIDACSLSGCVIRRKRNSGGISIITVTGASGGSGKTSLCLSLARMRKQISKYEPLVIDMKSLSDQMSYFQNDRGTAGYGINELLVDPERCAENPERYIVRDRHGVAGFAPSEGVRSDISSLDRDGMRGLIETIENWGMFDTIIFEMDGRLDDTAAYLYSESQCILSMIDSRRRSDERMDDKWKRMIGKYSGNGKMISIRNFENGKRKDLYIEADEDLQDDTGTDDPLCIPYDPDSFFVRKGVNEISLLGPYGASVEKIAGEVVRL